MAEIAKIDGVVEFAEGLVRGHRKVIVRNEITGQKVEHLIPLSKHFTVTRGELVRKGQQLTEGSINPQDLLDICGVKDLQRYLLNQIQEVYRYQGVEINDKHIESIIRQMLRKIVITDPGDTRFLYDDVVERRMFEQENRRVLNLEPPGRPAKGSPVLQGVTKAGLSTASFIAAASFQETTRVLTEAACTGRTDFLLGFKENIIMGHTVPSGTGFTSERLRRGFEGLDELYMGRMSEGAGFIGAEEEEEEVAAMSDIENIIQGVSTYSAESQEQEEEAEPRS
jgi:DNA-directed RNA polymerase subunit beta'